MLALMVEVKVLVRFVRRPPARPDAQPVVLCTFHRLPNIPKYFQPEIQIQIKQKLVGVLKK